MKSNSVSRDLVYAGINEMYRLGIIKTSHTTDEARDVYNKVEMVLLAVEKERENQRKKK